MLLLCRSIPLQSESLAKLAESKPGEAITTPKSILEEVDDEGSNCLHIAIQNNQKAVSRSSANEFHFSALIAFPSFR